MGLNSNFILWGSIAELNCLSSDRESDILTVRRMEHKGGFIYIIESTNIYYNGQNPPKATFSLNENTNLKRDSNSDTNCRIVNNVIRYEVINTLDK